MALTKTARLELINPYQKYGLKRRPTFDEIVGLVSENDKLMRPFPNREATRFRNSPQGSFFDGTDNLDLLKEQQTRILDRQMRENIMRRQTQQNGGTFHLQRHLNATTDSSSNIEEYGTPIETARGHEAGVEAETSMRAQTEQERREQTQQSFGQRLKENTSSFLSSFIPRRPENFNISTESHTISSDEEFADKARASQEPPSLQGPVYDEEFNYQDTIDYNNNIRFWNRKSAEYIKYQLFLRGVEAPNEGEISAEELRRGLTSGKRSYKQYLVDLIKDLVDDGSWIMPVSDEDVERRKKEWTTRKGQGKGKSFSQSVAEGAKEGVKQVAKAAAVKGGEMLFKRAIGI